MTRKRRFFLVFIGALSVMPLDFVTKIPTLVEYQKESI
jgi:hypothetical protein